MENNEFIKITIKDYINNATQVRCCGSCMGGCQDELVCFICCGFKASDVNEYYKSNPEAQVRRQKEIDKVLKEEEDAYLEYVKSRQKS